MAHQPHRILVVDDDSRCRALLDVTFATYGFDVTTTNCVLGASELVARLRPHVIVLDLMLPYRSGASWLGQLKADPQTAHIPVIILSALPEMLPRERRLLAQAVVRKPFRTRALVDTVRAACSVAPIRNPGLRLGLVSSQPQELLGSNPGQ